MLSERNTFECRLGLPTAWPVQLRGVEVANPHFDPGGRIAVVANTHAITVPYIPDCTRERCSCAREWRFTRICDGCCGKQYNSTGEHGRFHDLLRFTAAHHRIAERGRQYARRHGYQTDTGDSDHDRNDFADNCNRVNVTVTNRCQRYRCPPHSTWDAAELVGLNVALRHPHRSSTQYDQRYGNQDRQHQLIAPLNHCTCQMLHCC